MEERDEDARSQGSATGSGGVGGLFDVQMILEMRRRVLEDEDDDSDDACDDDWDE